MTKAQEVFLFYRHGHLHHIHTDRGVFEEWMAKKPYQYPPENCEIVRYVPDAQPQSPSITEVSESMLLAAMQALVNEEWHPPQPLSSLNGFDQRRYRRLATVALNAALADTRPVRNPE